MATPAEIRDAVDARLAVLWPNLVNRQATYLANRGRYFQGLVTHALPPADGTTVAADRLAMKPGYQAEDWAAFGVSSWTETFSLELHQYAGPLDKGWVAFARVKLGTDVFVRSKGVGPEDRDQGWQRVTVP